MVLGGVQEAAAQAGGGDGAPAVPAAVTYRQSIMQSLSAHQRALRDLLAGNVPHPEHVRGHAEALAGLARMASDIFPEGSLHERSRAKAEIWSDAPAFAERVTAIQSAGTDLAEAARGGDTAAVEAALQSFAQTCGACHSVFRGPALPAAGS